MNKFAEKITNLGMWAGKNKYLSAIAEAFNSFMPFTIIGAIGTLWVYVICNSESGLGALVPQVMALEFLNPVFNALNFCTMGCISIGVTFALGIEIGKRNNDNTYIPGLVAIAAFFSVTCVSQSIVNLTVSLANGGTATLASLLPKGATVADLAAVLTDNFGATGLFTGMIMAILSTELYASLSKVDKFKIKLPDSVPPNVAGSFNALIPGTLTLLACSGIGYACLQLTGHYVNDLIFNIVQTPLQNVGGTYLGGLVLIVVISLFWCVGIHGNNMTNAITQPMLFALLSQNEALVRAGHQATHIVNYAFWSSFVSIAGTGIAGAVTIAIFLVGKREDTRAIAKLAALPNCFNINEIIVFGVPVVLNPIMCIGFILAPVVCYTIGYVLTAIHFCPVMYINVPWTTPPVIMGFLASGGSIFGALTQVIAIAGAVAVYIPCIIALEKQRNAEDALKNNK